MVNVWDVLVFVVVGLALVGLVVGLDRAVFAWAERRYARRQLKVMESMHKGIDAMLRAAMSGELDDIANERLHAAVPVKRDGYAVQYRFHPHPRAECVNAQCADHYGPFPLGGARGDAR